MSNLVAFYNVVSTTLAYIIVNMRIHEMFGQICQKKVIIADPIKT